MKHIVMTSGGSGSWAAGKRVAEKYGTDNLYLLFSDVRPEVQNLTSPHQGEDEDLYRFLKDGAANIGGTALLVRDGRDIWQVFHDDRFLGNSRLANCSKFLKQKPARRWLDENCDPDNTIVYVGIDWTEAHRLPSIVNAYLPFKVEAPMCWEPLMDKADVAEWLEREGITGPRLYEPPYEFPHNNCGGFCVRAGQSQFRRLLATMPERYAYHEQKEKELRIYLKKNVAIMRDRRGGKSVPMTMRKFRERIESEQAPETEDDGWGGCGCFVDEGEESALVGVTS